MAPAAQHECTHPLCCVPFNRTHITVHTTLTPPKASSGDIGEKEKEDLILRRRTENPLLALGAPPAPRGQGKVVVQQS